MATATDASTEAGSGMSVNGSPPRDNIVRAILPGGVELREATDDGVGTLTGHFAVFSTFTDINSVWEGNFREQIAPGAFKKTFAENRDNMKVIFDHGQHPSVGSMPLGPIDELREDDTGAYYEVPLLDTSYNRDLIPGLKKGLYGASFRFRVIRDEFDKKPGRSDDNPEGIPERTIKEAQVIEFGPVVFPAYAGATAGVRSMTDDYIFQQFRAHPDKLRELIKHFDSAVLEDTEVEDSAPTEDRVDVSHPVVVRRETRDLFWFAETPSHLRST